jgi:hypothetical protein
MANKQALQKPDFGPEVYEMLDRLAALGRRFKVRSNMANINDTSVDKMGTPASLELKIPSKNRGADNVEGS